MFSIKHKLFISIIIFSIFFSVFFSGIAAAQTVSMEDMEGDNLFSMSLEELSEIKVTSASKEKQSQGTVEDSITVITRNQIEECGCTTLEELFMHMPGVFLVDTYEDLFIGMRGSIGGSVQFLLNGIPRHPVRIKGLTVPERARFNIPVEAIDRIEIVKGPKSVIYGNNAFLGSVNIITNDPEYDTNIVRAAAGNEKSGRGMARISHRFSEDAYLVANTEIYHTDGIDRDIRESMSPEQVANLDPDAKTSLDKMLQKTRFNTELYTNYKGLWADLNYSQMEYGFYAFAPGFDDGTRLDLNTLSLSLG
ncbi:MAG: TonB-dependent receptor plug domain-containing protein [Deltaproteobacteria bacterium]|nr:TonB-dependent receptor plug domain-containing protein [Deltaproteobacteria bacterium]